MGVPDMQDVQMQWRAARQPRHGHMRSETAQLCPRHSESFTSATAHFRLLLSCRRYGADPTPNYPDAEAKKA
jgi:hypothetical protein